MWNAVILLTGDPAGAALRLTQRSVGDRHPHLLTRHGLDPLRHHPPVITRKNRTVSPLLQITD